jgi:hypothetical protein
MCDAGIVTGLIITGLSTGLSMYGQYQAGKAQEASAKASASYNAQVAENEAATRQQLAQNEIAKGAADRERQQRQAARAMGEMRANMGASGFEMDSGSNLSLLAESAAEHQYDSSVINQNAAMAAWQQQVQGVSALNDKNMYDWQYANASSGRGATNLAMAGSLLGGIGTGIGQYNDWSKLQPGTGTKTKKAAFA